MRKPTKIRVFQVGRAEFKSLGRHHARVTELVYVPGSNPGAERPVSSNLTSRTIPGWCNGSTIGFDPVGRGSNPLLGATWFHGQVG